MSQGETGATMKNMKRRRRPSAILSLLLLLQLVAQPWMVLAHDCAHEQAAEPAAHAGLGSCHQPDLLKEKPACSHCVSTFCTSGGSCSAVPGVLPGTFPVQGNSSDSLPSLPLNGPDSIRHGSPPFRPPIHS